MIEGGKEMDRKNYDLFVVDISDILALAIKKFLIVLLICIIGALAGVGFHYSTASSEKAKEEFELELRDYNSALNTARNNLELLNNKKNSSIELMKDDPAFEMVKSQSTFICKDSFILDSGADIISDSGNIVYPAIEKMMAYFETLNLNQVLNTDIKEQYLDRIVLLSTNRNNVVITMYGSDKETTFSSMDSLVAVLQKYASDNGWLIVENSKTIEPYYGDYINDLVEEYNKTIGELDKSITEQTKALNSLERNSPKALHIMKYAVIGFILGAFIALFIIVLIYVGSNPVTKSFTAEKRTGKPFIGALFEAKDIFSKVARLFVGERKFTSESEAIEYIRSNIRNTSLKDDSAKNVAILCSCKGKDVEKQAKSLESVLSEFGCKATLVTDVSVNPESADVVSSTDAVILLERQWVSQWKLVGVSMDLAERFNKPVVGFVLC